MYFEVDLSNNNIILSYPSTKEHTDFIKTIISDKIKYDEIELTDQENDNFLNIYNELCTKYNNIIIVGSNEVNKNTVCISKITFDEDTEKYNEQLIDYDIDEFCRFLSLT